MACVAFFMEEYVSIFSNSSIGPTEKKGLFLQIFIRVIVLISDFSKVIIPH